jgi:D-xylose transport system substrate-binding protein
MPGKYLGAVLLLGCCAAGALAQSAKPDVKVGFLLDTLKVERWQTDVITFQKRATELGAETLVENAEGNDALQLEQAKKLLNAGVQALVIVAHDTNQAGRIVALANDKHVPVISYERMIPNANIALFVGINAREVGRLQAAYLTKIVPKGKYILLEGSPSDSNAHLIRAGQQEVLQPFVDRGDIQLVGDFWCANWDPLNAYAQISNFFAVRHEAPDAIVASNDGTATGAIQALEEHHAAGKVAVSGQDADLQAVLRLLQGTQTMTIYRPLTSEAAQAADAAVALARGQRPKTYDSIADAERRVPAILTPVVVVTKYNLMQTVIRDGFQNLKTIKESLPPEQWPKE